MAIPRRTDIVFIRIHSEDRARRQAVKDLNGLLSHMSGKSKKTDWKKKNLAKYAEKYLKKGGMSAKQISTLKKNLVGSY